MSGDILFDTSRIHAAHERAARRREEEAAFLSVHAAGEFVSRLMATNRQFQRVLVMDGFPGHLHRVIADHMGHAHIGEMDILACPDDLELRRHGYDLILAGPALHRRNDLPGTLVQITRALRPDGLFMGVVPGEGSLAELKQSLIAGEALHSGGAAMRIDPFVELRQAGALLQRAGFALPVSDMEPLDLRYGSLTSLIGDLRANAATNVMRGKAPPLTRRQWQAMVEHYKANHCDAEQRYRVTVNLIYLTGWSPHESQQKPLRPGSAEHRLADFLGDGKPD